MPRKKAEDVDGSAAAAVNRMARNVHIVDKVQENLEEAVKTPPADAKSRPNRCAIVGGVAPNDILHLTYCY